MFQEEFYWEECPNYRLYRGIPNSPWYIQYRDSEDGPWQNKARTCSPATALKWIKNRSVDENYAALYGTEFSVMEG